MSDCEIFEKIQKAKIIPVIKISDEKKVIPLMGALKEGGFEIAEITFRTKEAAAAIKIIKKNFPEILLGAGTVLNPQMAAQAKKAGAQFLVSPGLNLKTLIWAKKNKIPLIPGVATASEIECALMYNLNVLKFFPAEALGGVKMLKAFKGPFSNVKFIPTGGISLENKNSYLAEKNVLAEGGSWMLKENLIQEERWQEITELCKKSLEE